MKYVHIMFVSENYFTDVKGFYKFCMNTYIQCKCMCVKNSV